MQKMTPMDRLLSLVFEQYKTEFKPRYGSRLYTRLGLKFLGTPEQKGLDTVMPELRESYYNGIVDRRPPRDDAGIDQWDAGSRLVMPVRFHEERYAGKGIWIIATIFSLVMCMAAASVSITKEKVADLRCTGLYEDIKAGRVEMNTGAMKKAESCRATFARIESKQWEKKQ